MDFGLPHEKVDGVTAKSNLRIVSPDTADNDLDKRLILASNRAVRDLFKASDEHTMVDCSNYQERILPTKSIIEPGALIVIFESFDNLNFVYAEKGKVFQNRNGRFSHDDFIGKPFGSIVRSSDNRGYGFMYVLRPTPELWARSLKHRTQIVHELDASMIVHNLELRPNMVVCESGTGSGALSHCILRTLAPHGRLHTFEFNEMRAKTAREEFRKNGVEHLVNVVHKDVCGKTKLGGFDLGGQKAHAVVLDLPEPWLAVPHAAHVLKIGGRIASYSPCVEQAQRCVLALKKAGFHSIETMEYRLREHYVDEVGFPKLPTDRRQRLVVDDQHHLAYAKQPPSKDTEGEGIVADPDAKDGSDLSINNQITAGKKRKLMTCTRPFVNMRGHTAFLTFAMAGNKVQPDPNSSTSLVQAD